MASSSSGKDNTTPASIICSVCVESLTSDGSDLVTTNCGHAFHKECLNDWYNSNNKNKKRSEKRYRCPKCNKMTKSDCTRDLYLDAEDDTNYKNVVKEVKQLRHEKAETIEKLKQKDKAAIDLQLELDRVRQESAKTTDRLHLELDRVRQESAKTTDRLHLELDRVRQESAKTTDRLHLELDRLRQESAKTTDHLRQKDAEILVLRQEYSKETELLRLDLRKQITVSGIKTILLGPNKDLLDQQFGQLKWDDLTPSYQNELCEKLPPSCRMLEFNKSDSFSSNTLLSLIKCGPNDDEVLLKFIKDFFNQQSKLNGHPKWNDFAKLFKQDLLSKYEHPSLELDDLPLTPKTVVALMKDNDTENGTTLLANVIELFIENISDDQVNYICRRKYMEFIPSRLLKKLAISFTTSPDELSLLLRSNIPQSTKKYFAHFAVKTYFLAMVIRRHLQNGPRFRYMNPGCKNEEFWINYFLNYFYDTPSDFALKLINLRDETTADLFAIFLVMDSEILFKKFMADQTPEFLEHLVLMEWPCVIQLLPINLTMLHFAAIKGEFFKVQFLLFKLDFSKALDHPRFQNLVQVCVMETSNQNKKQIEERKKIIATFLNCSKNVAAAKFTRLTNVHIDLLKFLLERGPPEVRNKALSEKQMLLETAENLEPDQFDDLAQWLV